MTDFYKNWDENRNNGVFSLIGIFTIFTTDSYKMNSECTDLCLFS